jgi:exosortase family protein XrtF
LRALLIFIGWQLLYSFLLVPIRIPDRQLTNITCFSTAKLLSVFYDNVGTIYTHNNATRSAIITVNGHGVLGILDPCNALDIIVLYISFLFCFPGTMSRRIMFIIIGLPYIYFINTIRCALIAWLNMAHKGWVDISHHYIFTASVYLLVFYLWTIYTKKDTANAG